MGRSAGAAHGPLTVLVANPSADLYGSDRMLLEAVRGLVELGWRTVVTCSIDGPLVPELRQAGAEVRILPAPVVRKSMLSVSGMAALVRDILTQFPGMRRLVKDVGPDVVLANTVTIPFWTIAARSRRRPVVVYVHEAEAAMSRTSRMLLTAPLRWATGVIFNSETSRRVSGSARLERKGRTRVVPNGVRGPVHAVAARETLTPPARVVYVGRLSPRKGVDLAVEAIARLREAGVAAELELVGSVFPGYEWYEQELRALVARHGLDAHVRFTGFRQSVWESLAAADVSVVPSRLDESFGNVLVEAVMAARPVVVADHTGLREAAAGLSSVVLVAPDDADSLAAGVRRITEEWATFRRHSAADAVRAEELYGTELFHRRISEALAERTRPRSVRGIDS